MQLIPQYRNGFWYISVKDLKSEQNFVRLEILRLLLVNKIKALQPKDYRAGSRKTRWWAFLNGLQITTIHTHLFWVILRRARYMVLISYYTLLCFRIVMILSIDVWTARRTPLADSDATNLQLRLWDRFCSVSMNLSRTVPYELSSAVCMHIGVGCGVDTRSSKPPRLGL